MTASVVVRHNFETAHRLFTQGPGTKCWSLHGHSWWAAVTVEAPAPDDRGMVVEFGDFKRGLREWIDTHLDHGAVLNETDPLVRWLSSNDCKVLPLKMDPTVEAVADLIAGVAIEILAGVPHAPGARIARVDLAETHVNGAAWCDQ